MRLTDGTLTSMRISLPTGFPGDRPALSITSPVRHPWVDSIGRLSFPLLDRWGAPAVRLAAVVADAFKGLGGTPAPLPSRAQAPGTASPTRPQQYGQQGAAHPAPSPQSSSGQLSAAGSGLAGAGSRPAGPKVQPPPPVPSSFPEVEDMSEEQLAGVLADAAAYKRLVDAVAERIGLFKVSGAGLVGRAALCSCAAAQGWAGALACHLLAALPSAQEANALMASNRELAAANLALADEQADKRNQVAIIRSSEYAPAKAAFDDKYARQATVLEKLAPEVLLRRWAAAWLGGGEWAACAAGSWPTRVRTPCTWHLRQWALVLILACLRDQQAAGGCEGGGGGGGAVVAAVAGGRAGGGGFHGAVHQGPGAVPPPGPQAAGCAADAPTVADARLMPPPGLQAVMYNPD